MKSGCGRPTTTPTSRLPPRSTRTSRTGAPTTSSALARRSGGRLYPVGEEPGRKLADWIMHWYDPDEKHVYNDMGKRPGTRHETVMPWEHPSRTGYPSRRQIGPRAVRRSSPSTRRTAPEIATWPDLAACSATRLPASPGQRGRLTSIARCARETASEEEVGISDGYNSHGPRQG